jgi:hypothetical protein
LAIAYGNIILQYYDLYLQVLLLMASALKFPMSEVTEGGLLSILTSKLRTRQQNIAEITEMIHVSIFSIVQSHTQLLFPLYFSKLLSITGCEPSSR